MEIKTGEKLTCKILSIDLNKDNQAELVVFSEFSGRVYQKQAHGWQYINEIYAKCCDNAESAKAAQDAALLAGAASAEEPAWQDLKVGDVIYQMNRN